MTWTGPARTGRSGPRSPTRTCTPRWSAGRSRNDQVATDLRLYLRDSVRLIVSRLAELETALVDQAVAVGDVPAPGMTHLQHAQPVLFGHQLLAHVQAFARDVGRLR